MFICNLDHSQLSFSYVDAMMKLVDNSGALNATDIALMDAAKMSELLSSKNRSKVSLSGRQICSKVEQKDSSDPSNETAYSQAGPREDGNDSLHCMNAFPICGPQLMAKSAHPLLCGRFSDDGAYSIGSAIHRNDSIESLVASAVP